MKTIWIGSAPSSRLQPPTVLISISAALTSSSSDHDHARALHDRLVAVGVGDDHAARAAVR